MGTGALRWENEGEVFPKRRVEHRQVRSGAWPNHCGVYMKKVPQSSWGAVSALGSSRKKACP